MLYSDQDRKYVQSVAEKSASKHVNMLKNMIERDASYSELFAYGRKYLPQIRNRKTSKVEFEKLNDYEPEIVEFFDVLSEIPSLPEPLKNTATDLAIYANGESVQTDSYYERLDPDSEIEHALKDSSGHV